MALPFILAGAGAALNAYGQHRAQRQQNRQFNRMNEMVTDFYGRASEPNWLESFLKSQFNTGQDGQMQLLRAMPGGTTLDKMSQGGGAYDMSNIMNTLQPLRNRQMSEGLAQLSGGASGLGARFGSAMGRNRAQLVQQMLEGYGAQDSQLLFQGHEAAQGRRLQAAQSQMGTSLGMMQLLGQLMGQRSQAQTGALGMFGSLPQPSASQWGQPALDIGQLLLLKQLMG
jgi:hypothetical protein